MDIEQLKLVLEMVGTATEGAMWFAFAWLAKGFVTNLLLCGLGGYAVYKIASMVSASLEFERASKKTQAFVVAMRDADPSVNEALKYGFVTDTDERDIRQTHRRGCEAILAERNADDRPGQGS